ncbi:MAG: threonine synthase [Planctomycetota bacterium]
MPNDLRYISTRGQADPVDFTAALMTGLAPDGGLFVPESWPRFSADQWRSFRGMHYAELACHIMRPFVDASIDTNSLQRLVCGAYCTFAHQSVAPLRQLGPDRWLMELYHGPTLAFKDVAMQVLGRLYDHTLERTGGTITVVGATSGDTGSAAIEAFQGRDHASIVIMHPAGRTSEVQRRQMTTVHADNVLNLAVDGTFDDCQDLLKAMFNTPDFRQRVRLSGVNSINWARVLPQAVYYCAAALALGAPDRPVAFSVPTGNFGDVYAGYVAAQMGLPIERLIVASNQNDILPRAFATGDHTLGDVHPTMSPSMDIQVSSNFERLLFDAYGRDAGAIAEMMTALRQTRALQLDVGKLAALLPRFVAVRCDEHACLKTMRDTQEQNALLVDPHTATGLHAVHTLRDDLPKGVPVVTLATAHPAKFPAAVEQANGVRPPLPEHLADLYDREERYEPIANDLAAVMQRIDAFAAATTPA